MGKVLTASSVILGLATAFLIHNPQIVIVGLYLGILPGLLMSILPTLCLWSSTFTTLWWLGRIRLSEQGAIAPALATTVALMWFIPQALSTQGQAALDRLDAVPDIIPERPIQLVGEVVLSQPAGSKQNSDCDALCAALLATPEVTGVTLGAHRYHLVSEDECRGTRFWPDGPGGLNIERFGWRKIPGQGRNERLREASRADAERRLVNAEWQVGLSTKDCVLQEPAAPRFDFAIRVTHDQEDIVPRPVKDTWSTAPRPLEMDRIVLADADGNVLLRKTFAKTEVLQQPLVIGSDNNTYNNVFSWWRKSITRPQGSNGLDAHNLLARRTNLYTGGEVNSMAETVRGYLVQMLDSGRLTSSISSLMRAWFASFANLERPYSAADRDLMGRLIADGRITEYRGLYSAVHAMGPYVVYLRPALARRLAHAEHEDKWAGELAQLYELMPQGAFAISIGEEEAILHDLSRRTRTEELIARQADKGKAATPLLMDILTTHWTRLAGAKHPWEESPDQRAINGARRALCMLGTEGAEALPQIEEMLLSGLIPASAFQRNSWRWTLERLGKPKAELPPGPERPWLFMVVDELLMMDASPAARCRS